jgi:hypothetical protein
MYKNFLFFCLSIVCLFFSIWNFLIIFYDSPLAFYSLIIGITTLICLFFYNHKKFSIDKVSFTHPKPTEAIVQKYAILVLKTSKITDFELDLKLSELKKLTKASIFLGIVSPEVKEKSKYRKLGIQMITNLGLNSFNQDSWPNEKSTLEGVISYFIEKYRGNFDLISIVYDNSDFNKLIFAKLDLSFNHLGTDELHISKTFSNTPKLTSIHSEIISPYSDAFDNITFNPQNISNISGFIGMGNSPIFNTAILHLNVSSSKLLKLNFEEDQFSKTPKDIGLLVFLDNLLTLITKYSNHLMYYIKINLVFVISFNLFIIFFPLINIIILLFCASNVSELIIYQILLQLYLIGVSILHKNGKIFPSNIFDLQKLFHACNIFINKSILSNLLILIIAFGIPILGILKFNLNNETNILFFTALLVVILNSVLSLNNKYQFLKNYLLTNAKDVVLTLLVLIEILLVFFVVIGLSNITRSNNEEISQLSILLKSTNEIFRTIELSLALNFGSKINELLDFVTWFAKFCIVFLVIKGEIYSMFIKFYRSIQFDI